MIGRFFRRRDDRFLRHALFLMDFANELEVTDPLEAAKLREIARDISKLKPVTDEEGK